MMKTNTVLIIDEQFASRSTLKELLKEHYEVITADSAADAMETLSERHFFVSLILLTLCRNSANAAYFLQNAKLNRFISQIPIVVIAGEEFTAEEEVSCIRQGAADYIKKPLNHEVLQARIENIIKLSEAASTGAEQEFDRLTGLYTKESFFARIKTLLDKNPQKHYDFVVADVENFGGINHRYGMGMGNRVLQTIGRNFSQIRMEDSAVARIRDDIFAAFSVYDGEWEEEDLQRLMDLLLEDTPISDLQMKFGVYKDVDHAMPVGEILENALSALDSIRNRFGTSVALYDNKLVEKQKREKQMELAFEGAIANKEFEIWLQPKYESDSQNICGAEALVRWRDAQGVMISPGEFIPVFERDGLIRKLDEYMFIEVCRIQKNIVDKGMTPVPISVNISGASLYRDDTANRYISIVNETGINPAVVPIEITESVAILSGTAKEFSEKLYRNGFTFHMDDFGSGYSSLVSLQALHFDVIKLDKSLIDYIGTPGGNSMLKHTIAFSKESGMRVVAEGVENQRQRDALMRMGCDYIQGYYYSAPLPVDKYEQLLQENEAVISENVRETNFSLLDKKEVLTILTSNMTDEVSFNKMMGAIALATREKGNYLFNSANEALLDIFDVDSEFVENTLHRNLLSMVHYEDRPRFKQMFRESEQQQERGAVVECRFVVEDKLYWCRVRCHYLRQIGGAKEYYLYFTDKTTTHFHDELLSGVPGGFLIYRDTKEAEIVYSNRHLWNIYGCETEEEFRALVGNSFKGLVHPEDYEAVASSIAEQMQGDGKKFDYVEYRIKRKDGEVITVCDFGHLVYTESGEYLFYVFISEKR